MLRTFLISIVFVMAPISVWAKEDRLVSVTGDCFRNVTPDRGTVTLTAEVVNPNAGEASQKVIDQYNKIRDRVKKLGLKNMELETSEFSVNEDFDWANNVRKSRGFRARMGLRVTSSEATRMGEVAGLASELKVQDVSGLQSFASRELMRSERESCLEEAFKNARNKATTLAKTSGMKLGSPVQIREDMAGGPMPGPMPIMAKGGVMMMADSASSAPAIETGTSKLSVSVQAVFELL